jgi:hypothetical protein
MKMTTTCRSVWVALLAAWPICLPGPCACLGRVPAAAASGWSVPAWGGARRRSRRQRADACVILQGNIYDDDDGYGDDDDYGDGEATYS